MFYSTDCSTVENLWSMLFTSSFRAPMPTDNRRTQLIPPVLLSQQNILYRTKSDVMSAYFSLYYMITMLWLLCPPLIRHCWRGSMMCWSVVGSLSRTLLKIFMMDKFWGSCWVGQWGSNIRSVWFETKTREERNIAWLHISLAHLSL